MGRAEAPRGLPSPAAPLAHRATGSRDTRSAVRVLRGEQGCAVPRRIPQLYKGVLLV